jgi:hypothetical protein
MSRREALLTAAGIFAVALVVRVIAAAAITYPVPEDTAYYVGVARNLVEGHGLISDALWSYQTPPLTVPRAAFEIWLPLPTFLAALPMALLGPTFRAAQVAAVLVGAIVPVLAWRIAADVAEERGLPAGRARTLAIGAGLVAAVYGPVVVHGALPDSTMPFTALALLACLLMVRLLRMVGPGVERTTGALTRADGPAAGAVGPSAPAAGVVAPSPRLPRGHLVALGVVLGLAALTRNEALWLALAWAGLAWWGTGGLERRSRLRLIAVPAVVSILVYAPWAIRDWLAFGSPLPGQALANALSVKGTDIFAWEVRPTLARYLAQGPAALLQARVDGFGHNLVDVLLVPAIPAGPIGLLALPWQGRGAALRPLLVFSLTTFWATTLFFPVATEWGTFLHAAGPVQVLLLVTCLLALDALLARVGRWRGWYRPVAWLGPVLVAATAVPVLAVSVSAIAGVATTAAERYQALGDRMTSAGVPPRAAAPVIADHPIWISWSLGSPTLGLPDESPSSVLDLARRFGAGLLVVSSAHGQWPAVLGSGAADASCFVPLDLSDPATGAPPGALADTRAYGIGCESTAASAGGSMSP